MVNENLYRKRECDLCHSYAFEKHLGTAQVLDGGFTRVENWEKSGFGAIVVNFWEFNHLKHSRMDIKLCSACAEKLRDAICDAIGELKTEVQDG